MLGRIQCKSAGDLASAVLGGLTGMTFDREGVGVVSNRVDVIGESTVELQRMLERVNRRSSSGRRLPDHRFEIFLIDLHGLQR